MSDWVLAIDFGTTSTAAAIRVDDRVRLVAIEGAPQMPSMVFWREGTASAAGELVLGRRIENLASRAPWCLERTPKRRIADDVMQLGDQEVRVVDAIAEILRKVAGEATRLRGGQRPTEVRLTHPARWGAIRLEKLREAAAEAGFAAPVLLPEPVAAAVYFASERLTVGQHVAVYDLGGGTFDTAVLRRTPGGFEVVGSPGGQEDLGGEDFDDALYRHLGGQLPADQWQALRRAATDRETSGNAWREANVALQREARLAKEVLSDSPDYDVRIPVPVDAYLPVRADELARLIRPDIEETVAELERTIETAGLRPSQLAAIYLAGGSSRIPLVSELIRDRLGQSPDYLEDPKSVIALGAARAPVGAYSTAPPTRPAPPPPPTQPTVPVAPEPEPTRPPVAHRSETPPIAARPAPSRRRAVQLGVLALVVVAVVVGLAVALGGGGKGKAPQPAGPSTTTAAEVDALHRLGSILAVASQGRTLIVSGDYNGAIANRRAVLRLLDDLGSVPADLVSSVAALRAAEAASLDADQALRACHGTCSPASDAMATTLKRRFADLYNPVAARYGAQSFSPDLI